MKQAIIRCENICNDLNAFLQAQRYDGLFILTDSNCRSACLPLIQTIPALAQAKTMTLPAGDGHKNIHSLSQVWNFLSTEGANRKSLLINLGGGMITDLGGFAAATFKRGIRFINLPTTLLGAVDAAVGGKTGINFNDLKNEIGAFAPAVAVLIDARFFQTLDAINFRSGYAEMLKHALLDSSEAVFQILTLHQEGADYYLKLNDLVFESVKIKERIVAQDPTEQGIRKALNLGHTFAHAFESLAYDIRPVRPLPHGYAVAWGLVCELYLSFLQLGFNQQELMRIARFVKQEYGAFAFDCAHYPRIYERMQHDKKNESSAVRFSLLRKAGDVLIDQTAGKEEIEEVLDFYRDFFH
jgi:3-dehydroquinate synthase